MKKILFIFVLSLYSIQGYASSCPDGSEPVRSISEDGTYFVFNCSTTDLIKKQGGDGYDSFPVHEFAKSPLRDLEVQENWQLFKDPDELDLFHSRFKYAIDEKGPLRWWKMSSYVDDCERATAEFDIEAFKLIEETGDRATFFIRCKTFFTHKHFRDQDEGIKVFERILLLWAKNKPIDYPDKNIKNSHSDIAYAATMTVGDFASFYAIYYDDFNFNKEQRQAVDDYLSDWLINYDLEPTRDRKICNLEAPETFEIEGHDAFGIYADYCGSNRWRMGLGAVYLGLRTGNQRLFTAGNRHIEINLAAIDKDGIFPQWSRKGALALSYQRQLPEVLTLLALAYESIGYDFYEHQLPHGKKIHEVYEALFDFIYHPEKLNKYAFARWDFVGKNAYEFDKLTLKEKWRREYIYPEVLASQSKGYVLRYRPDLMGDIDYSENWKEYGSDYVGNFVSISGLAIYEAVHQNISKIELEIAKKAEEKTDFCKESVDGFNTATWFAASTKDDVGWEFVGTEKISFDGCKGQFEAAEDFQPEDWFMMSKELRRELNVNINPDGSINISGDLDLDYSETQRININDKKASGVVSGYFNPGWLLKVELKNK
ncbi:alginate lyase family protein [Candidatus Pseudothioglobus singularis]|nr:alginate lyase family protein [Candidatus Pseudothioglobus singularis]